jgi:hypothetical protein
MRKGQNEGIFADCSADMFVLFRCSWPSRNEVIVSSFDGSSTGATEPIYRLDAAKAGMVHVKL